jgi:hypothetical protein
MKYRLFIEIIRLLRFILSLKNDEILGSAGRVRVCLFQGSIIITQLLLSSALFPSNQPDDGGTHRITPVPTG